MWTKFKCPINRFMTWSLGILQIRAHFALLLVRLLFENWSLFSENESDVN